MKFTFIFICALHQAVQRLVRDAPDHPAAVQLTGVYHNLLRRWAEL